MPSLETDILLDALRAAVDEGELPGPLVRARLVELDDPAIMRRAGRILGRMRVAGSEPARARVHVLATCTVGSFLDLLRGVLVGGGVLPEVEVGAYGRFDLELGSGALLGDGEPDVVICLMDSSYFLSGDWDPVDIAALGKRVLDRLADLRGLLSVALNHSSATFVLHTVPMSAVVRNTVISLRDRAKLMTHWYRLNTEILALAEEYRQVVVVDLVGELAENPVAVRDDRLYHYGDLPYTDGALLSLARQVSRVVQARLGLSRKVLALDLDNTLWGGVVAEVGGQGVELGGLYPGKSYQELQRTANRLHNQGVPLVLISKNDVSLVDEVIAGHPEMVLRGDSFTIRAVNWASKTSNLREAARTLSVSPDSFVFMDDSEFELGSMRRELPEVAMVSANRDPAYLARSLVGPGWFDVIDITEADRRRPALYQSRALRDDYSHQFGSSEEYLHELGIKVTVEPVTPYTVARVAQLAARTNQFNLTGLRFDETRTSAMSADPDHLVTSFSVSDRFGAEGIVGAGWLDRSGDDWCVLNLVLSCRVLGRGIELAIAGWLARTARESGATTLTGRFVPSKKNAVSASFWKLAGFTAADDDELFTLDLADFADPTPEWIAFEERISHG